MDLGLPQGKPGEDGDDGDNGISPTLRLTEQGIEVSYDKGDTWNLLVPISEFHVTNNITNEYINNPDEEDITVVDDKLKFKDKEYNLSEFSGLGRVYLRKNIVNGKNILAYNAFNSSSTIYHIQYDYDLDGRTVVVPNNCILLFEGGSLSNGTIVGNDTVISAQLIKIFNEDISLDGTWKINGIYPESGGGGGADGKTPVMQIGNVTTVDAGGAATANVRQDGIDVSGNPIYKIDFGIPRGADGSNGVDGKTPVFETGTITTLEPDQPATCNITKIGDDQQGNPIYRVDVGIPKGNTGEPGATPSLDGYATEAWVTTQITNTVGIINASLDNINGEIV